MGIGFGSKLKALNDMGITPNEIREKFDIPNQFFLGRSQTLDDECMEYLREWGLDNV
tara:strand:- start:16102 stop:16272 length:171 start_codon:yes stop_codon:yes gene_type:complete